MDTTEAAWTPGVTEDDNMTQGEDINVNNNNTDDPLCEDNYIPTVDEYREAMGWYQTALLAVGGTTTGLLYLLFAYQVYHIVHRVDKRFRRHVIWLTSVCPFMALLSVVSVVVPRADTACTAFKVVYLSLAMSHFMDMTTEMFGNEKIMLTQLSTERFNLHVGPACYCCFCLPSPTVKRSRLRSVRWLLWQLPYTQAVNMMVQIVWSTAMSDELGRLDPNFNMIWLISLSFVSVVAGIYGLQITTALCRDPLQHYGYQRKSFAIKILVMASQLQSFTLDILGLFNIYPCLSSMISPRVFKQTLENTLYIPEMLVVGIVTWLTYNTLELEANTTPKDLEPPTTTDPSRPRHSCASIDKGSNTADKGLNAMEKGSSTTKASVDKGLNATPKKMKSDSIPSSSSPRSSIAVIPLSHPSYSPSSSSFLHPPTTTTTTTTSSSSSSSFPRSHSSSNPPPPPPPPSHPPPPSSSSSSSSASSPPSTSSSSLPPVSPTSQSSSSIPPHSSTSISFHNSKNCRISPDSCLYSASPTTDVSMV